MVHCAQWNLVKRRNKQSLMCEHTTSRGTQFITYFTVHSTMLHRFTASSAELRTTFCVRNWRQDILRPTMEQILSMYFYIMCLSTHHPGVLISSVVVLYQLPWKISDSLVAKCTTLFTSYSMPVCCLLLSDASTLSHCLHIVIWCTLYKNINYSCFSCDVKLNSLTWLCH